MKFYGLLYNFIIVKVLFKVLVYYCMKKLKKYIVITFYITVIDMLKLHINSYYLLCAL